MNWKQCSFYKHYKRVHIEGYNPERLINICLSRNLNLKRIKTISENEIVFDIRYDEFDKLREITGGRYKIGTVGEYGVFYRLSTLTKKVFVMTGLLLFAGILIYQSLFISEIDISGYESINEQALRESMKKAGFYEGCRKNVNLEKVKLHLYEDFDNISWIGIKYKGNLAQISIAENDYIYEKKQVKKTSPCNIVAAVDGYINSIDPEQGVRTVDDGAYVEKGEVVISGEIPLEKTTYDETEDIENISYVHAAGTVVAKVPVRLNYYIEANELVKNKTGRKTVAISFNDRMMFRELCPYELSQVRTIQIFNWVKPVRIKFEINIIEEFKQKKQKISEKAVKKQLLNEIHKFVEEKLPDNTQILNKSLNFSREKNIIYIGVTLETLQEIGKEEEIIVDKSNRQSDQNDDQ